jgi:hypothetical protein
MMGKWTSIALAFAATLAVPCAAANAQQVSLGLKGGINSATTTVVEPNADIGRRTGIHAGAVFAVRAGPRFSVQLEGLYSQRGYRLTATGTDATVKGDYLQVPLVGKVTIPLSDASPMALQIFFGPTVAFEVSCQAAGTIGGVSATASCDDLGAERRKFDFGAVLGGGFDIHLQSVTAFVTAAYDYGLRNLDPDPMSTNALKHRTFAFSLGFLVPVFGRH